jgi:hypothetical protein
MSFWADELIMHFVVCEILANLTQYLWNNDTNKSLKPFVKSLFHILVGATRSSIRKNRRTQIRSETRERAGVPETAKEERRGISDTISLDLKNQYDILSSPCEILEMK